MANSNANQEIQELRDEVQHLTEMLQNKAKNTASGITEIFDLDTKNLRRAARKAGKNVREYINDKSKQMADLRDDAEDTISTHPFVSISTAVAGGFLLGALLNRK